MTKAEFLLRFNLLPLRKVEAISQYTHLQATPLRAAAVLIALIEPEQGDDLQVLLTKRASHLKHHPSQISFPGGKVEPEDNSLIETAIREAYEEVGLSKKNVTIAGQLANQQTRSGFHVTPIIALVSKSQHYHIDENEVSEVFQVPLKHFLTTKDQQLLVENKAGRSHAIHFYPYQDKYENTYNIWGATALMIKELVDHLS